MSQTWKTRPSQIYGIIDPLDAYYFDRAILYWGSAYEADVQSATAKAKTETQERQKREMVNRRWLKDEDDEEVEPQQFRDPVEYIAERAAIDARR